MSDKFMVECNGIESYWENATYINIITLKGKDVINKEVIDYFKETYFGKYTNRQN